LFIIGTLTQEEVNYLEEHALHWLMGAKFWLGFLFGESKEDVYIQNDELEYRWLVNNGARVVISAIESKYRHADLKYRMDNLVAYGKEPFLFRYPKDVPLNGYYVVEYMIEKHFRGIKRKNSWALCDVKESDYCGGKHGYLSLCEEIDKRNVCNSCQELFKAKASKVFAGYIYLIGNVEKGIFKIGKSRQPKERYKAIATKLPFPAEIIHVVGSDDTEKAEKILHTIFASKRTHGEWFELPDEDVAKIVNLISFDGNDFVDISGNKVNLK